MKRAFIFGEFINKSTTGIAYVNTNLKSALKDLRYDIKTIDDPRSNDYFKYNGMVTRNIYFLEFIRIIINILNSEKYSIAYLTISMSYLGLLKSLLITSVLKLRTNKLYLYIHRGDLDFHNNRSLLKKILIRIHFLLSSKIILLSKIFLKQNAFKKFQKKILVIPNSLSKYDSAYSNKIYEKKLKSHNENYKQNIIKLIFSANIHSSKGIHEIIKAVKIINEEKKFFLVKLDIFGMKFEDIDTSNKHIKYRGKLSTTNRLNIMSDYDFLILSSKTEGLPITLIECLAIGLPFITTNIGAIPDLLIENYPYVSSGDYMSILKNIEKAYFDLENNRKYINSIIKENNKLFHQRFQYKSFVNSLKINLN